MPVHVVDEHNEAFICIDAAMRDGMFKREVVIVHVDSHEDMDVPTSEVSCYDTPAREYAERHLTIGDFLPPLLLKHHEIRGIIYVNRDDRRAIRSNVGSLGGEGKLLRTAIPATDRAFYPDLRKWSYKKTTDLNRVARMAAGCDCILDIDCDYFAVHQVQRPPAAYRSTAAQTARMNRHVLSDDDYRIRLKVLPEQLMRTVPLTFNASPKWIRLLIDYFCSYLTIEPKLTVIARSAKSGFTPARHARMIEERLVAHLEHPPSRLRLPLDETLRLTRHVAHRGNVWYSHYLGRRLDLGAFEAGLLNDIQCGKTVGNLRRKIAARAGTNETTVDYLLLRFLFNLKKIFVVA